MNQCLKCNELYPNWVEIDGKKRNLQNRKHCLVCVPFKEKSRLTYDARIQRDIKHGDSCVCERCGREYIYERKKGHTLHECNSCVVNKRRLKFKKRAVEYKGGKCVVCGYKRCIHALGFHHLEEKDFTISGNYFKSWDIIQKELDKCILVCFNCHIEIHHGVVTQYGSRVSV